MNLAVFCDFDGTITQRDTCVAMSEKFCRNLDWKKIEADWQNGALSTAATARLILAAIDAPRETILAWLDGIAVDPHFAAFAARLRKRGDTLTILSDGYDLIIRHFLEREGLDLPFFANHLESKSGRLVATFPAAAADCDRCGCCKRDLMRRLARGRPTVIIGDGRSDLCAAGHAGHVFAKGTLAALCRENGIGHIEFKSFADLLADPFFAPA